ncbi:MAG: hypothetical protein HYR68_13060, partial [Burkholderiales bacterium]|nr:hypothetical protein [Burkholderiales bacterium]
MSEHLPASEPENTHVPEEDVSASCNESQRLVAQLENDAFPLRRLMTESLRVSMGCNPRWHGIPASPALLVMLMVLYLVTHIGLQRLMIVGAAQFYWQVLASGWFSFAALAWSCYCLRPLRASVDTQKPLAPDASHFFVLALAQALVLNLVFMTLMVLLVRLGWYDLSKFSSRMQWLIYLTPPFLALLIQLLFLWRASDRRAFVMWAVVTVMVSALGLEMNTQSMQFWYPRQEAKTKDNEDAGDKSPEISQEVFETQSALLSQKLGEIQSQRPGIIDLYSLSFAPYGEEKVFLNETSMVAQVMANRFDAAGRSLQLVNNPVTINSLPWATPLNLQR